MTIGGHFLSSNPDILGCHLKGREATRMHESFFGLQKRPFLTVPTLERYCPVASHEAAFQSSSRAIVRAEGPVAILGGTGLGKSMVCLRIAEVFRRNFEVILLASSQLCSRRALLQNLLFELRMPYRELSEGELRLSLLDRLQPSNENPSDGLVLIVDEAQTLPVKLLEELRLITNLTRDGIPRVRLVLCGTTRLEEMLGHPQLESLNQRLACRCYLSPLNQQETVFYLTHKVELCGANIQSTFTEDSMRLVHRATDGVPRLIDQLADHALRLAAESRQRPVSASLIESAWASLQQLPLPWSDHGTPIAQNDTSIEYGSLLEDGEEDFTHARVNPVEVVSDAVLQAESLPQSTTVMPVPFEPFTVDRVSQTATEFQAFERPLASPIPSAGMGLSRVAASIVPSAKPIVEQSAVTDFWDDFVTPSGKRFETGPIEDYVEDLLDYSAEISLPSSSLPETVDFQPNFPAPVFEEACDSISNDFANRDLQTEETWQAEETWQTEETWPSQSDAKPPESSANPSHPSTISGDLFGADFDEEIEIVTNHHCQEVDPALRSALIENFTFEINPYAEPHANGTIPHEDTSLLPYNELLDSLSTANLEAMTLDPKESLDSISFEKTPEKRATHHDFQSGDFQSGDFQGGLSRQTRNSILSFADLQQNQHPIINDDRDLLIIEDDLPSHESEVDLNVQTPAAIHPYKQLFSRLRG